MLTGFRVLGFQGLGLRVPIHGCMYSGPRLWFQDLGIKALGFQGIEIHSFGFKGLAPGLGQRVQG